LKTLILYASAGSGHKKAAEALYSALKNKNPQDEILCLDILDFATPILRFTYKGLYEFLITRLHFLWGVLFFLSNKPILYIFNKKIRFFCDRNNLRKLADYIIEFQPGLVVSTHFLSSELAIFLKEKAKIHSKIISIVTDFGVHYIWAKKGADKYIVATDKTKKELARFGISEKLIEVLGIPVREQFYKGSDRAHAGFNALVMTGGIGAGPIEKIVDALYKEVNLIVVCGNNKRLFKKLSEKNYTSVKVLGFVDNVDEYMSISDILITKAGGLTISEALVKMLPMIFFFLVPGQEKNNARLMQDLGIGIITKNVKQIKRLILEFRDSPNKLVEMKNNIKKIRNVEIANFIEKL
jgi:processive 1,2-diacylglycerol beta-glucosyltransferase